VNLTLPIVFAIAAIFLAVVPLLGGVVTGPVTIPNLALGARIAVWVLALLSAASCFLAYRAEMDEKQDPPTASPTLDPIQANPTPETSTWRSSTPSSTTAGGIKYQKSFNIRYINFTGYLELDEPRVWNGDQHENPEVVDVAFTPDKVVPKNVAKVALSSDGGKNVCEAAIEREAPDEISMGQVENDKGFCALSDNDLVAYVSLKAIANADDDHLVRIQVTAYN
jgi:hypothetical protein